MAVSEQILNPVIIQNLEAFGQNFQEFVIQVRQKDNHAISWTKTIGGRRVGLKWVSLPCVFDQTVKGRNYEVRVAIRETNSDTPVFSAWETISVGDSTPPPQPGTLTITATGIDVKATFSNYTKPVDFKEFQWHVDKDNTAPASSEDITHRTDVQELVIPGDQGEALYFWVRAADTSGNVSAWRSGSGNIGSFTAYDTQKVNGVAAATVESDSANGKSAYDEFGNRNVQNLIKNWSFEQGTVGQLPTNWGYVETNSTPQANTAITKETGSNNPDGGSCVAQWTYSGTAGAWSQKTKLSDAIKITDNTLPFVLTGWWQHQAVLITGVYIVLYQYSNIAGTTYLTLSSSPKLWTGSPPSSGVWRKMQYSLTTLNSSTKSIRVGFSIDGSGVGQGNDTVLFDAVSFYAGSIDSVPNPFILTEETQSVDIAEKYITVGAPINPGSIVTFGQDLYGKPTMRVATCKDRKKPLFIVSTRPFFSLTDADSFQRGFCESDIALIGRVPCMVRGRVKIGDRITVYDNGVGKVAKRNESFVGYAITKKISKDKGLVIVFVDRK